MKISWLSYLRIFLPVVFIFIFITVNSQDGEKLFKVNCAACHHPIKNSTGPKMQGVKEKWESAGEGDLIYKWVKDPNSLYNSGKSKLAKAIWDFSPTAMPPIGHLSNEEIDAVFSYVDSYSAPVVAIDSDGAGSKIEEGESQVFWWWIILAILILFIFGSYRVRRQLSNVISEKEGIEIEPDKTFSKLSSEWILRNWFVFVLLFIVVLIYAGVDVFGRLYEVGIYDDYQPSQPIAFSHKLHAGDMGIECKNCHHSAEKSKHAGIPTANVCMVCHQTVEEGTKTGVTEIDKIYKATGYDKVKKTYNKKEEQPIVWNKAHNLPDHVFFSHAQHVHPNTANIDCRQCHGNVETYSLGRVSTTEEINAYAETDEGVEKKIVKLTRPILTMGWCIECHNEYEVDLNSNRYYETIHERLKKNPGFMRSIYEDEKVTVRELGGWECGKCHY